MEIDEKLDDETKVTDRNEKNDSVKMLNNDNENIPPTEILEEGIIIDMNKDSVAEVTDKNDENNSDKKLNNDDGNIPTTEILEEENVADLNIESAAEVTDGNEENDLVETLDNNDGNIPTTEILEEGEIITNTIKEDATEVENMENEVSATDDPISKTESAADTSENLVTEEKLDSVEKENNDENVETIGKEDITETEDIFETSKLTDLVGIDYKIDVPEKLISDDKHEVDDCGKRKSNGKERELKVHDLQEYVTVATQTDDIPYSSSICFESPQQMKEAFNKITDYGDHKHHGKEYQQEFTDPFKCVIKTVSLQLLDEQANTDVKKKQLPIMTMNEVVIHNKPDDCWVIINGVVRDLTPLIQEYKEKKKYKLVKPIVAHAGKDISHWFNEHTNDILYHVHPITGVLVPYTPHGRIPDVGYEVPTSKWQPPVKLPWWQENNYIIGIMTKSTRPIRIKNTLNGCEVLLHVCCEDTLYRIQERYLAFNKHSQSYTWKYEKKLLNMSLTLDENGIKDERKLYSEIRLNESAYIPCLMLYFNDDLTEY